MVHSLGADHVIDYTQQDFTKSGERYHMILDMQAHHSIFKYKRCLNPKGTYKVVGGSGKNILQTLFIGPFISLFGNKKMSIAVWRPNNEKDINCILELIKSGNVVPFIDKRYPLRKVPDALRYFEGNHHKGKIVIIMEN